MGAKSLAEKLTLDTGKKADEEDAKIFIQQFKESFPTYADDTWDIELQYSDEESTGIHMEDGWSMWTDNHNVKSVCNMPIQSAGAQILRKAIQLAQDAGLTVIIPLHDALYIEIDSNDLEAIDTLEECMREAFGFYFEGEMKQKALELVRMDIDIWGPDWKEGKFVTPKGLTGKSQPIYIDERSEDEYKKFSKYFQ
jgi:hypothetical protein